MGVRDDLTAAAGHVAGLRKAVTALTEDLGNTIDVQRLRDDVVRLADDVDLVARGGGHRQRRPRGRARRDRVHPRRGLRPGPVVGRRGRGRRTAHGGLRMAGTATVHRASAHRAGRRIAARTLREDRWWLPPLVTFVVLVGLAALRAWSAPPRSGTTASTTTTTSRRSTRPASRTSCVPGLSRLRHLVRRASRRSSRSAILTLPFLLLFRLTCYYYRKAYYRSFWLSPPACAVAEPHAKYTGETRFPLILQNAHRYFFYAAVVISLINTYDAIRGLPRQGRRVRHRASARSSCCVNVVLLWAYTVSLPLLPAHHRRPAQALLQAPGPLLAVDPGVASSTPGTCSSPGSRSATLVVTDVYIALVSAGRHHRPAVRQLTRLRPTRPRSLMTELERHEYDVVVIGAGGAGLRAAIEAREAGHAHRDHLQVAVRQGAHGDGRGRHRRAHGQRQQQRQLAGALPRHHARRQVPQLPGGWPSCTPRRRRTGSGSWRPTARCSTARRTARSASATSAATSTRASPTSATAPASS